MRPITTLARPFVAAPYIMTGLETLRDPRTRAEQVAPTVKPIADRVDWLPKDPETLVRIEGALSLGTGRCCSPGSSGGSPRCCSPRSSSPRSRPSTATGPRTTPSAAPASGPIC
ncbi:hypothetical protein ACFQHO_31480 [Actinomadura yumaensis]|uniref:hypothetical protein n=1 Tax=Actinomadura yumaensis TaxID=111807 RepID=UPI00361708EF